MNGQTINPANGHTTQGKSGIMRCRDRDNGQLQREEELRDGKFIGLVRFYKDGKRFSEHVVNEQGNRDGLFREFLPDGQVMREATYRNGKLIGISRSWYQSGRLKRVDFQGDNRKEAVVEYNTRGQLKELKCADRPMLENLAD